MVRSRARRASGVEIVWPSLPAPRRRADITSTERGVDAGVRPGRSDGTLRRCVAHLDELATIRRGLLERPISALSPRHTEDVGGAAHRALGLPPPCRAGEED